jgi:hypothetical protein
LVLGTVGLTLSLSGAAQELFNVPRRDGGETALRVYSVAKDCALLAVISPGAGGTEDGYAYLANGLRDSGWLAVVMGHKESGPATLRKEIRSSGIHESLPQGTAPFLRRRPGAISASPCMFSTESK